MRKLYIPVFSNAIQSKRFSIAKGNPGVGGTEFNSIILALTLASAHLNWQIVLGHQHPIILEDAPSNIVQEIFPDISAFLKALKLCPTDRAIVPALILIKACTDLIKQVEQQIVCWSHHPFDVEAQILNSRADFRAIVCVGTYQFYSNTNLRSKIYHIQNLFYLPPLQKKKKDQYLNHRKLNILFLGALTLGKGFAEIAKAWKSLKQKFPDVKLHVIGSSATYGWPTEAELVPTSKKYASQILRSIPEDDIHQGRVIFHGNLGIEKWDIMAQCDIALLNPTGQTEAFPASVLECMACGIPVIASNDYGMSDTMRFFPELVINNHKNITDKVEWLISNPSRYREMQQRSLAIAQEFSSQTNVIVKRWHKLVEAISSSISESQQLRLELSPTLPFFGVKAKLRRRQFFQSYFILKMRWNMFRSNLVYKAKNQNLNSEKPLNNMTIVENQR